MDKLKTVLFYVLGLAGLVMMTSYFTGQVEVDITPLPTATPRPTPTASPTPVPEETGCVTTSPGSSFSYRAGAPLTSTLAPPDMPGTRLVIAGTVYASDCETPLSGITVEAWQNDARGRAPDRSGLLRARQLTDSHGRYRFTTIKPGNSRRRPPHIHFRLSDPLGEPLLTTVAYFDSIVSGEDAATFNPTLKVPLAAARIEAKNSLSGTFDIVLPVEPPEQGDCETISPGTGIRHNRSSAPFTNTLASPLVEGARLIITGTVLADDAKTPLSGALLEVWQTDARGRYEQRSPHSLQARLETDQAGRFEFSTIRPGYVRIGCNYLPAHINYLVSYQDYRSLFVTQFFAGDPYLPDYPQVREESITELHPVTTAEGTRWRGTFDIVLPVPPLTITLPIYASPGSR